VSAAGFEPATVITLPAISSPLAELAPLRLYIPPRAQKSPSKREDLNLTGPCTVLSDMHRHAMFYLLGGKIKKLTAIRCS